MSFNVTFNHRYILLLQHTPTFPSTILIHTQKPLNVFHETFHGISTHYSIFLSNKKERKATPLNCSPSHRPIYQSHLHPLQLSRREAQLPLFSKWNIHPFSQKNRIYQQTSKAISISLPLLMNFLCFRDGITKSKGSPLFYFLFDTTRVVINNRTIARNYRWISSPKINLFTDHRICQQKYIGLATK